MGLLDFDYTSNGILPFGNRWSAVEDALRNGAFDPKGANGLMPGWPPTAYASAAPQPQQPQQTQPASLPMQQPQQQQGQPQQQPSFAPPMQMAQAGEPSMGDRLGAGLSGFANSGGGLLPAISNLFGGISTGQRQDPIGKQEQAQAATYQALSKIMPEPLAKAATLNPELLKTLAPEYMGTPKVVQVGEGPLGKTFMLQQGNRFHPIPGISGVAGMQQELLAPGVKEIDPSIIGDAKLGQYSAAVQAAVKAYQRGDVMPTGNPRQQGLTTFAKSIAQQIAVEGGTPASDSLYGEKRTFHTQLGMGSPASRGGQVNLANTSLGHLGEVSDSLVALDNKDYLGGYLPSVSHAITGLRGEATTKQKSLIEANLNNADRYGKESTKLYAGSPGGQQERREAQNKFGSGKLTNMEAAALLQSERNLLADKIAEQQRDADGILGPGAIDLLSARGKEALAKIDANLAKLKGEASPSNAAASTALSAQDQQAIDWANANPKDPRAAQIKKRLGIQ